MTMCTYFKHVFSNSPVPIWTAEPNNLYKTSPSSSGNMKIL